MGCIRLKKKFLVHQLGATCAEIGKCDDNPMSYEATLHYVHNYYGPYAHCSLDKRVAYTMGNTPTHLAVATQKPQINMSPAPTVAWTRP